MRAKSRINEMQARRVTICEYCGAEKQGISFCIGASKSPAWTMIEGTGAMCCPACWEKARRDGSDAINRHVTEIGRLANEARK